MIQLFFQKTTNTESRCEPYSRCAFGTSFFGEGEGANCQPLLQFVTEISYSHAPSYLYAPFLYAPSKILSKYIKMFSLASSFFR